MSMLHPANVATPELAARGLEVQLSTAPFGVVSARVTEELFVVITFPKLSSTDTEGWVANAVWLVAAELGCVENATLNAGPGLTVTVVLTALVSDPSVAVRV